MTIFMALLEMIKVEEWFGISNLGFTKYRLLSGEIKKM